MKRVMAVVLMLVGSAAWVVPDAAKRTQAATRPKKRFFIVLSFWGICPFYYFPNEMKMEPGS